MPLDERRSRHQATFQSLLRDDIETWAERFLSVLGRPRGEVSDLDRMATLELY
jgi:trehalose-6-phosphate synthase